MPPLAGCSATASRPAKPWVCRSKTLTPTPEPAGYCAGDVAGERGAAHRNTLRRFQPTRHRGSFSRDGRSRGGFCSSFAAVGLGASNSASRARKWRRVLEERPATFEAFVVEREEFIEPGDDRLRLQPCMHGRGAERRRCRTAGAQTVCEVAAKDASSGTLMTTRRSPRSLGLSEQDAHADSEPAGYCAGDVAGERGDRAGLYRRVEPWRLGRHAQ